MLVRDSTNGRRAVLDSTAMPTAVPVTEARARILASMATLVAEKGYAAVTIDDLARGARISKRTFYDHFADKERCFLAAYDAAAAHVYEAAERAASDSTLPARARVDAVFATYLKALAARPEMTRVFHVEIQAAGPEALDRHLAVNRRYAALLRRIVRDDGHAELERPMAIALLGAVHELVLHAIADGRTRGLPQQAATIGALVDAALAASAPARSRAGQ
jgi:AcrR family transcriptional regulator